MKERKIEMMLTPVELKQKYPLGSEFFVECESWTVVGYDTKTLQTTAFVSLPKIIVRKKEGE